MAWGAIGHASQQPAKSVTTQSMSALHGLVIVVGGSLLGDVVVVAGCACDPAHAAET